jgi:hypothetical protein
LPVSHRPLVLVSGLTFGDYLLWSWSLNSNHDVLALISGLTLPPLGVACLWLLVLSLARLAARTARSARRPRRRAEHLASAGARGATSHQPTPKPQPAIAAGSPAETAAAVSPVASPSRKLAA